MNNYLLFIVCLIYFLYSILRYRKELMSPAVIFTTGFLLSSFMFVLNTDIWNYVITDETLIYMSFGMGVFLLGCQSFSEKNAIPDNTLSKINIEVNSKFIVFLFFLISIIGIVLRLYVLVYSLGSMSLANEALGEYRMSHQDTPYDLALKFISPCMSAIAIYAILNFLTCKYNKHIFKISSFVLICGFFIFNLLSSARIEIIYLFIYILVFYVIVKLGDSFSNIRFKNLALFLGVFAIFFVVFFALGFLTGKSQEQTSVFDNISIYTCSSIGAFCEYQKIYVYTPEDMFTDSFKGIYTLLSYMGIDFNIQAHGKSLGFVQYGNMTHTTNVYTFFQTLLHDFGYIGSYIGVFIEGGIYQKFYNKAKKNLLRRKYSWLYFYMFISPFILLSSVAERFCNAFLTLTSIVFVISIIFINSKLKRYNAI